MHLNKKIKWRNKENVTEMLILIKADPFTKVFHVFFLTITKSEFYD